MKSTDNLDELTREQLDQLDCVDNAIYQLVNDLLPANYRQVSGPEPLEWDMAWIGEIADCIEDQMIYALGITDEEEKEKFCMEFRPFIVVQKTYGET